MYLVVRHRHELVMKWNRVIARMFDETDSVSRVATVVDVFVFPSFSRAYLCALLSEKPTRVDDTV
jgi:hypothetical protein